MAEPEFGASGGQKSEEVVPKAEGRAANAHLLGGICTRNFFLLVGAGWRTCGWSRPLRPLPSPPLSGRLFLSLVTCLFQQPVRLANAAFESVPAALAAIPAPRPGRFTGRTASSFLFGNCGPTPGGLRCRSKDDGFLSLFGRGWLVTKKDMAKAIAQEMGIEQKGKALEVVQRVLDGITETLVQEKGRIETPQFRCIRGQETQAPESIQSSHQGEE